MYYICNSMDLKKQTIISRVSEKEKKRITAKASSMGLSVSAYIRMIALKQK